MEIECSRHAVKRILQRIVGMEGEEISEEISKEIIIQLVKAIFPKAHLVDPKAVLQLSFPKGVPSHILQAIKRKRIKYAFLGRYLFVFQELESGKIRLVTVIPKDGAEQKHIKKYKMKKKIEECYSGPISVYIKNNGALYS